MIDIILLNCNNGNLTAMKDLRFKTKKVKAEKKVPKKRRKKKIDSAG